MVEYKLKKGKTAEWPMIYSPEDGWITIPKGCKKVRFVAMITAVFE